jgi:hypothetical protein
LVEIDRFGAKFEHALLLIVTATRVL